MQGCPLCSVKKLLLQNPKKWKPDQMWQNLLRKAVTQKWLFSDDDDDDDHSIQEKRIYAFM
jgi:hypothetical protein